MNASDQAAEWFVAQRTGALSHEEREQFMRWLNDSTTNVREYLAIAELWGSLSGAPALQPMSEQELIADLQRQTKVEVLPERPVVVRNPVRRARRLAIAAGLMAMVGAVAWMSLRTNSFELTTRRGEQRTLELSDGSILQLNALSHVRISYDKRLRRIELQEGEALFRVAKDPTRPFEVATSDAIVKVLGTVFNVRRRGGDTRVAVVEGKVQVSGLKSPALPLPLSVNQSTSVASGIKKLEVLPVEPRKVTAWTQRRLIFDEESLQNVVAEFNLYNKMQLTIDNAALEQQRINGVFDVGDPQALIAYLERIRGVTVREQKDGIHLRGTDTH